MGKVKKVSIIYLIHAYNIIILYSRKLWRGLIWQFGEFGKDSQIKNLPMIIDYCIHAYGAKNSDHQI